MSNFFLWPLFLLLPRFPLTCFLSRQESGFSPLLFMKNPIHLLVWLALTIVSLPLKADWGDPSGFFDKEKIKEEELHPGVVWWSIDGELKGKPEKINLITVDLEKTDLKPKVLLGERFASLKNGQRFRRSFVSQLHADNDVVAAINVSFFDIGATQAPSGLTMQDGMIYREPSTSGRICLVFSPDGRAALAEPKWKAEIEIGGRKRPLGGINKPGFAKDEVVLYQTPWAESPGNSTPFSKDLKIREIVVEKTGFQPAAKSSDRSKLNG